MLNSVKISTAERGEEDLEEGVAKEYSESKKVLLESIKPKNIAANGTNLI